MAFPDALAALADQIRVALEAAGELDVQVEQRMVLVPSPLTIDVYPGDPVMDPASIGMGEIGAGKFVTVRARINTPDFDASYDLLVRMMDDADDLSLAAAVFDDPTLSGYATSLDITGMSGLRAYERIGEPGLADLGFQVDVLVIPAFS